MSLVLKCDRCGRTATAINQQHYLALSVGWMFESTSGVPGERSYCRTCAMVRLMETKFTQSAQTLETDIGGEA